MWDVKGYQCFKSTYTGGGDDSQCVALDPRGGAVVDTKDLRGPVLEFSAAQLAAFVRAAAADEFNVS